jgi:AcrR family transcriptional regulator
MVTDAKDRDGQPATLREQQKMFARQQLLKAAREEFASRGYANTTVEDIASRVGASRGTFYMHFSSKAEALGEISDEFQGKIEDYWHRLDAAIASGSAEDLRGWLESAVDWFAETGALMVAWEEAIVLEPEFKERVKAEHFRLPEILTSYLERWPAEQHERARVRILLLETQLWTFFTRWPISEHSEAQREMIIDELTEIWHAALQAPTPRTAAGRRKRGA